MRFFDLLSLSVRMFKARTLRTLLTVLGMSVGIAAIFFLVSLGYGLQRTLLEKITTSDALVSLDVAAKTIDSPLTPETARDLATIPEVIEVIPIVEPSGQGTFNDKVLDINLVASTSSYAKISGLTINAGHFFDVSDHHKIVITAGIAKIFGLAEEDMIGRDITLTILSNGNAANDRKNQLLPEPFTVSGIVKGEDNSVYLSIDDLPSDAVTTYTKIKVKCSSTGSLSGVSAALTGRNLSVSSISDTVAQANKVFTILQIILMIFGLIALIVSAIGMFNTMTIALLERTEEIGIMKAIGASPENISTIFITEATLMGFLGAVGGIALGFLEGRILNLAINLIAQKFGGSAVNLFYAPLWFVITVILFGAFVGFLTGIFPARQASSIDTLEALRYK